jgi:hypothetical protein
MKVRVQTLRLILIGWRIQESLELHLRIVIMGFDMGIIARGRIFIQHVLLLRSAILHSPASPGSELLNSQKTKPGALLTMNAPTTVGATKARKILPPPVFNTLQRKPGKLLVLIMDDFASQILRTYQGFVQKRRLP